MARPVKAIVDYFSHDVHDDDTLKILVGQHNKAGYYFYYRLRELLGVTEFHVYDCRNPIKYQYLLTIVDCDADTFEKIMALLVDLEEIDRGMWEQRVVWSQPFVDRLVDVYSRRTVALPTKSFCEQQLGLCKQKPGPTGSLFTETPDDEPKNPQSKAKEKQSKAKELPLKNTINIPFETFWDAYGYKTGRPECELIWDGKKKVKAGFKLTDEHRTEIMEHAPVYASRTHKDDTYPTRKHPHTYLYNQAWLDELPPVPKKQNGTKPQTNNQTTGTANRKDYDDQG